MISRLCFVGIVTFWLIMTSLLVRMQIAPRDSSLREIPPEHVLRVMFEHQQASDLNVKSGGLRYGSIIVRPTVDPNGERVLFYGGSTLLRASFLPRDRLSMEGQFNLDPDLGVRGATGSLTLREAGLKIIYTFDRPQNTLTFNLQDHGRTVRTDSIRLDRDGLGRLLRSMDADPSLLDPVVASGAAPRLTAHYTKFSYRNEKVDAYNLVLKRGNTTLAEIYVSQLGQILSVTTPFGLQFAPGELLP